MVHHDDLVDNHHLVDHVYDDLYDHVYNHLYDDLYDLVHVFDILYDHVYDDHYDDFHLVHDVVLDVVNHDRDNNDHVDNFNFSRAVCL